MTWPMPTLQKAASSLRNHTNYNSIAMDQTETVDSEIFSAEEEERPDESAHPIGEENCSSNNSSDTAVVKAGEDIKDASVIENSPIIPRKPRSGAHSQSLQSESNSCLTEKLRDNCSLPLVLDSESQSPVFKRRQRGGGNLLKTTLSREQVAKADIDAPGSIVVEAQSTTSSIEPLAEILPSNEIETAPLQYNTDSQQLNISVVRRSGPALSRSSPAVQDAEADEETSPAVRCVIASSVKLNKDGDDWEERDSSPILPSTQELSGVDDEGDVLPSSQVEEDPRASTFYDLVPHEKDANVDQEAGTMVANVAEVISDDKEHFAVPSSEPRTSPAVEENGEDESNTGRGRRIRRLTSKMLESPARPKETKRNSTLDADSNVEVKKGRKSLMVAEPAPEPKKSKAPNVRKSAASRRGRASKAGPSEAQTQEELSVPEVPTEAVEKPIVENSGADESKAPRRRKRKGESEEIDIEEAKQSRKSSVTEVLISTRSRGRGRGKYKEATDPNKEKESEEEPPVKRGRRIENVKEEPKGKLRRGGRKLAGVASLSVMMTESADEGDVKQADQTGTNDAPESGQVQVKTATRARGRVKKGEQSEEVQDDETPENHSCSPVGVKLLKIEISEEKLASAGAGQSGRVSGKPGGKKSSLADFTPISRVKMDTTTSCDEEGNLQVLNKAAKAKAKRGGKEVKGSEETCLAKKTEADQPTKRSSRNSKVSRTDPVEEKAPDTQPMEEEVEDTPATSKPAARKRGRSNARPKIGENHQQVENSSPVLSNASLSTKNKQERSSASSTSVRSRLPDLLHVIPVGDDSVLNGVLEGEDTSLGLGLISNIGILLSHTNHHSLVAGTANNGGEDSSGSIISSKSSLAHAGAIVNNKSSNVFVTHLRTFSIGAHTQPCELWL